MIDYSAGPSEHDRLLAGFSMRPHIAYGGSMAPRRKTSASAPATGVPAAQTGTAAPMSRKKAASRKGRKPRASKAGAATRRAPSKKRGHRYSDAERERVLEAAAKGGLTGDQVAERFGVTRVTYYAWKKKAKAASRRGPKPV